MRQIGRIFLDVFEAVHAAVFVCALTCIFNSPILKWLREFKKRTERRRPPGEMRVWGDERASFWVFLLCASSLRHRTPPTESAAKPSLAIIKATQQHQIIMNKTLDVHFVSQRYNSRPLHVWSHLGRVITPWGCYCKHRCTIFPY